MIHTIESGPRDAKTRLLLAHGAGAPMTSPFLDNLAELLAERNIAVSRFEFAYMAGRRTNGKNRPAAKAELLTGEYHSALAQVREQISDNTRLYIGGKSLGGRVASMIAEDAHKAGTISGLVCLGYPFHPPGKPETLRTAHLADLTCPSLIVQGDRDPFGNRAEVQTYTLAPAIQLHWLPDGDHDFGPRGASGYTRKGNLTSAADAIVAFIMPLETASD